MVELIPLPLPGGDLELDLFSDPARQVLCLRARGLYRRGSAGNPDARLLVVELARGYFSIRPCAILLDFSQLEYVWGDSILGLFQFPAEVDSEDPIPIILIVGGDSEQALGSLLRFDPDQLPDWVFGDLGLGMAAALEVAQRWLDS